MIVDFPKPNVQDPIPFKVKLTISLTNDPLFTQIGRPILRQRGYFDAGSQAAECRKKSDAFIFTILFLV